MRPEKTRQVQPDQKIPVSLTDKECDRLLKLTTHLPDIASALRLRVVEGSNPVSYLTVQQIEQLTLIILCEMSTARTSKESHSWDQLCQKLQAVLMECTDKNVYRALSETITIGGKAMPFVEAVIQSLLDPRLLENMSPEESVVIREKTMALLNQGSESAPDYEVGGLTDSQVGALLCSDWDDKQGALQFNENLSIPQVMRSEFWSQCRAFLRLLHEKGEMKASRNGILDIDEVVEFLSRIELTVDDFDPDQLVLQEAGAMELWDVHLIRVILGLAGLIELKRKSYRLTPQGQFLLQDQQAGKLYALLFRVFFRKFSLDYLDLAIELRCIQDTLPYTLYQISKRMDRWKILNEDLVQDILFPAAAILAPKDFEYPDWVEALEIRVFDPLELFGLVEIKDASNALSWIYTDKCRKTPLFDQFLKFDLR